MRRNASLTTTWTYVSQILLLKSTISYTSSKDIVNDCVEYVWHDKVSVGLNFQKLAAKHVVIQCNPADSSAPPDAVSWLLLKPGLCYDLNSTISKRMCPNVIKDPSQHFITEHYASTTSIYWCLQGFGHASNLWGILDVRFVHLKCLQARWPSLSICCCKV